MKKILTYFRKHFPYTFDPTVSIGKNVRMTGTILIGHHSYMNGGGCLRATDSSPIIIGKWCAIGYNVSILAQTHDSFRPTGHHASQKEASINIGDYVWIGNNAVILPGVTIGDNTIIGANTVIHKSIPANMIVYHACQLIKPRTNKQNERRR